MDPREDIRWELLAELEGLEEDMESGFQVLEIDDILTDDIMEDLELIDKKCHAD
jgi:hypothetical protein